MMPTMPSPSRSLGCPTGVQSGIVTQISVEQQKPPSLTSAVKHNSSPTAPPEPVNVTCVVPPVQALSPSTLTVNVVPSAWQTVSRFVSAKQPPPSDS